ncbi:MAG: Coenzyme F420 hydrogenase/dehydrogenase, beta subunit C-terminal domain [Candidatus Methanofastidiosia archaeon]
MTKPISEKRVVKPELCVQCGLCFSVCPQTCIDMGYTIGEECIECGLCTDVCPGPGVHLKKMGDELFPNSHYNKYVGRYTHVYTGYSIDSTVRSKGTSGGVVTSLLQCLLERNIIDGAAVVSFDGPWKTTYTLATSVEDIIASAQTKYQLTPFHVKLHQTKLERIAVVGVPCVIHGLRNLQKTNIGKKIAVLIGLFCWVNMVPEATKFLLDKLDITNVDTIEYRSGDYLGGFKAVQKNGNIKYIGKECYNVLPLLFAPERCVYCTDFTNELADISMGDAKFMHSEKGHTFVIVRSETGEDILKQCSHTLHLEESHIQDIIDSEKSSLLFKKAAYNRINTIPDYGEEHYTIPLKNRVYELIFMAVHSHRAFFKKIFKMVPLPIFVHISKLITKRRS